MPLLWAGCLFALWLLLEHFGTPIARGTADSAAHSSPKLDPIFYLLLVSLAGMIAWRSESTPNTLAAVLCLLCIALAAQLSARLHVSARLNLTGAASTLAWGWLIAGLVNSATGLTQYAGWTAEPMGTAFGFLRQRNQLATLCNIALLSLLYLWLTRCAKPLAAKPSVTTALAALACLLLTASLAATCSRVGLIELAFFSLLGLGYATVKRQRKLGFALAFALISYLAWAWILPTASGTAETIFGRVASLAFNADGAVNHELQDGRRLLWANTITLIQGQPWLGIGWRELAHSLSTTDFGLSARFGHQADNAHNLPLQLAAELGVPFATFWFALVGLLVIWHKPWRAHTLEQVLAWGVLAVIALHSLLEYPLWYAPFQVAVGLSAGLLFAQPKASVPRYTYAAVSQYGYGLAGISLLCFCTYAAFDYNRVRQLYLEEAKRWPVYRESTFDKARASWLFAAQVRFAKLTTTPATPQNARALWLLGHEVLHFSPEPLVFEALIRAGEWLATDDPKIAIELAALQKQLKIINHYPDSTTPALK